jgi:hypothetical protein
LLSGCFSGHCHTNIYDELVVCPSS